MSLFSYVANPPMSVLGNASRTETLDSARETAYQVLPCLRVRRWDVPKTSKQPCLSGLSRSASLRAFFFPWIVSCTPGSLARPWVTSEAAETTPWSTRRGLPADLHPPVCWNAIGHLKHPRASFKTGAHHRCPPHQEYKNGVGSSYSNRHCTVSTTLAPR